MHNFRCMFRVFQKTLLFTSLLLILGACQLFRSGPPEVKLNLSRKYLTEIPDYVFNITELTELNLHNNKLTSIPPEIKNLKNLKKLILSRNEID